MRLYMLLGVALFATACDHREPADTRAVKALTSPSNEPATKGEFEQLSERVAHIEDMRIKRTLLENTTALLDVNATGFSLVDTPVGPLSLRIMSVAANGSGSHVKLAVGNTTSATLLRPSANIEWGTMDPEGDPEKALGSLKRFNFLGELNPGQWKEVIVPLSNTPPDKVGYLRVEAALVDGMMLVEAPKD